jgi:hypothetical protein
MKIAITALVTAVVVGGLLVFLMITRQQKADNAAKLSLLTAMEQTVQKELQEASSHIERQLQEFSEVIAADKQFSLKILVENDRSSQLVTEMAEKFMGPMGFSVLEISDASHRILSSGHFPASAGNSNQAKMELLTSEASAVDENIMGTPTLTIQAKSGFAIAGFNFYTSGGITLDDAFLRRLTPNDAVTLLLKHGEEYIGKDGIRSISPITDHQIIINDKELPASELVIPSSGDAGELKLIVILGTI